jgi:hypothetical protein
MDCEEGVLGEEVRVRRAVGAPEVEDDLPLLDRRDMTWSEGNNLNIYTASQSVVLKGLWDVLGYESMIDNKATDVSLADSDNGKAGSVATYTGRIIERRLVLRYMFGAGTHIRTLRGETVYELSRVVRRVAMGRISGFEYAVSKCDDAEWTLDDYRALGKGAVVYRE